MPGSRHSIQRRNLDEALSFQGSNHRATRPTGNNSRFNATASLADARYVLEALSLRASYRTKGDLAMLMGLIIGLVAGLNIGYLLCGLVAFEED